MKLRIHLTGLSPNDADGILRECAKLGADGKIAFSEKHTTALLITQEGELEDLMATASIAFHEEHFNIGFSN